MNATIANCNRILETEQLDPFFDYIQGMIDRYMKSVKGDIGFTKEDVYRRDVTFRLANELERVKSLRGKLPDNAA